MPAPAPPTLPQPDWNTAARCFDCGDRSVELLLRLQQPPLALFDGLLSAPECAALIESARPRLARSLTVQTRSGGSEINPDRTSSGMFFGRGETELVQRLEARIARLLRWPVENGEGLQVLHYPPGGEYKPHYDYFDPAEPGTAALMRRGGQALFFAYERAHPGTRTLHGGAPVWEGEKWIATKWLREREFV